MKRRIRITERDIRNIAQQVLRESNEKMSDWEMRGTKRLMASLGSYQRAEKIATAVKQGKYDNELRKLIPQRWDNVDKDEVTQNIFAFIADICIDNDLEEEENDYLYTVFFDRVAMLDKTFAEEMQGWMPARFPDDFDDEKDELDESIRRAIRRYLR